MNTITQRVESLRSFLKSHHLNAFIFPSSDPHCGEYIPAHWESRRWISGFNGSAGTAVVTLHEAALWTDSRYYLAAAEQLADTPFVLMKDGLNETPSVAEWLTSVLQPGDTVGLDGAVNTMHDVLHLQEKLQEAGIQLNTTTDPVSVLWGDRPALPLNPIVVQPLEYAGISATDKLSILRTRMEENKTDALIISALDEIAWCLNLRGTDVPCNPVFVAYLLITSQTATLFTSTKKLSTDAQRACSEAEVNILPYEDVFSALSSSSFQHLWLNPSATNYAIAHALPTNTQIHAAPSPVALLKAIKNENEIAGFRRAMLRDGVALVRFLKWLEESVPQGGVTECSAAQQLAKLRAEECLYRDVSFDTIAGYGAHGAIVHYEPTPDTDIPLQPKGFLLLDSGAQYQDGTTDVTRTLPLGPLTPTERLDYTLVLKGHIALSRAVFPAGTTGTQLDICARYAMWQEGINYGHGTGHGVGAYLNVHEGPHQIRMNYMPTPLQAGMTVTDEPGIYRAGSHGVRIENTLLIVARQQTEFGEFLSFEPLTRCPISLSPVLLDRLTPEECEWIDAYHHQVYTDLAPLLDDEHRNWLQHATRPIHTH